MRPSVGDIWKWETENAVEPQYLLVVDEGYGAYECLNLNINEISTWLMDTEDEYEGLDWELIA